jgi:hypothetical protein
VRHLPDVAGADYLIAGYADADDALREYERTGRATALLNAAAALCNALSRLESDDGFWADLSEIKTVEDALPFQPTLDDVDVLLDRERQVLTKTGLSEAAVADLLDAIRQIREFFSWPDEFAAGRLRDAVGHVRRGICAQSSYRRERQHWGTSLTKGLAVAGGGAVIVADAKANSFPVSDFSIYAGGKLIDLGADGFFRNRRPFGRRRDG